MIEHTEGNLISAEAEALVNTVNCEGYMGKGIALQVKQAFPANFKAYEKACLAHEVEPGRMFIFDTASMVNPRYIINFPTKRYWREKSRIEDIESGLKTLIEEVRRLGIRSVAVPPLGCGLGGLDWNVVRPMIAAIPEVRVLLYSPQGSPAPEEMPVRTRRPKLTPARALFIKLMDRYSAMDYRRTLLEIQKLAYFLQEAGEPLRLRFEKGLYGPYAHNLNKVLELLEGHYTSGFGDSQKPDTEIELLPNAVAEADAFLGQYADSVKRLEQVSNLIAGFETPYGMELLSSVHWVGKHDQPAAQDERSAVQAIQAWNERKRRMFHPNHIKAAWNRLKMEHWI
jgi:O-acetyl-ADP-ribose deacetylase (regulator of RNase III)